MKRFTCPYIIDIEASGFGSNSYPTEVGLALEPEQRFCSLINMIDRWRPCPTLHKDVLRVVSGLNNSVLSRTGRCQHE